MPSSLRRSRFRSELKAAFTKLAKIDEQLRDEVAKTTAKLGDEFSSKLDRVNEGRITLYREFHGEHAAILRRI
jgi:hypothetical protein